jgi:Nucleotidyltransferase domain
VDAELLSALVFGSAARGDGDVHSDIDLLVVRSPVAGETGPRRGPGGPGGLAGVVAGYAPELMALQLTTRQASKWARQVEQPHELVPARVGNRT